MPNVVSSKEEIDVSESDLRTSMPKVLETLLVDHTSMKNIYWATDDYAAFGRGFSFFDPILPQLITGPQFGTVIRPRVLKDKETQTSRSKSMAEVFTPSWICNKQNNLIDEAWFGRPNVFNVETDNSDGSHSWETVTDKIEFPDEKSWTDYVKDVRLEISCGEGPYLVSRYDTTTGNPIPVAQRIGLLDRKLRIVSENTPHEPTAENKEAWRDMAYTALQSTYGFEWQGDSLLLAREATLFTFIEHYHAHFGELPREDTINHAAYIIACNLWQMDGLKGVLPRSCEQALPKPKNVQLSLDLGDDLSEPTETTKSPCTCQACEKGGIRGHIGVYAQIHDWAKPRKSKNFKVKFVDLMGR